MHLRGAVKSLNNQDISGDFDTTIGYLPDGFAPSDFYEQFVIQGSGVSKMVLRVNTDGDLAISRYGSSSEINMPATCWINCYASWFVDKPSAEQYLTDDAGNQLTDDAGNYLMG